MQQQINRRLSTVRVHQDTKMFFLLTNLNTTINANINSNKNSKKNSNNNSNINVNINENVNTNVNRGWLAQQQINRKMRIDLFSQRLLIKSIFEYVDTY